MEKSIKYLPGGMEKKWQEYWEKNKLYRAEDYLKKPKKYILVEFPYPSGDGLHVGHVRGYSALDALSRKKRMEGYNVLFPIGWDAFGLPTENYAIKTGVHPQVATAKNIANFKRQMKSLGLSFDWEREINTTDPKYYKWTQWIFLQFFKKGLAYQSKIPINWCPFCKIGLAHEEVVDGKCERCKTEVEQRNLKQWMLKITAYADRLLEDLDKVDYLEKIKILQRNWIGKSYGADIDFKIENFSESIKIFTTRADTLFGVTAVVLAPEHPFVASLLKIKNFIPSGVEGQKFYPEWSRGTKIKNYKEVQNYIEQSKKKGEFERTKLEKEKTGVFIGSYCINPGNNEKIPIWIGDYVVATYGGGAVMVVPAHDKRDYDFAKKYGLEIREVISGGPSFAKASADAKALADKSEIKKVSEGKDILKEAFVDYGILVNSGQFNSLSSEEAIEKITQWLDEKELGKKTIKYKLRDWIFSRQHYWGEPIPIIHCEKCGTVPVPEKDLPIKLPYVEKYQPTGTGESPLANILEWVNTKCPKCGGSAKRETDTMPNWAGSSWYFMRYLDPHNNKCLVDLDKLKYWMPVDCYNGGMEHTTLHLLYSRFWYKFLFDIGVVPQSEPYRKRISHGMVLAEDSRKMSKSFGNIINPDNIVEKYGADTLRVYEMFMGPFDQDISWSDKGVMGVYRFLDKVWKLTLDCINNEKSGVKIIKAIHKLNKKIDNDLEAIKFNTLIAAFMEFVNFSLKNSEEVGKEAIQTMLILLSPFAPHIAEELWHKLGYKKSIFLEKWPKYDEKLIIEEKVILVIQVNSKVRDKIEVDKDISMEDAQKLALNSENIKKWINGKEVKKVVFIPGRLVNIVV